MVSLLWTVAVSYTHLDVYKRQPLGNVVIESGFCRKPVIASNVDGIPEIIEDGKSGILIKPTKEISFMSRNPNAAPFPEYVINFKGELSSALELSSSELEKQIKALEQSVSVREELANNLFNRVREEFSLESYFEKLESIYSKVF